MSYRLPKLNGLRAFEATARHGSFTEAAAELGVTAGAVSQQVKILEADLDLALFRRLHGGLVLTAAGEAYLPQISAAFRAISEATEAVAPTLRGRKLRFAVARDIEALLPPNWYKEQKLAAVAIRSKVAPTVEALETGKLDAIVRFDDLPFRDLAVERFIESSGGTLVLACKKGIAGCTQHRAVIQTLRSALESGHND